jgi:ATP-dependent helicase HrpA
VTLFGITLAAQRAVVYSKHDPPLCRELFIREALVNGLTKIKADFLQHNAQLVEEVANLEHKSRRRDILVDEEELIGFYQERLPDPICTEAGFLKWWKQTSVKQPKLLHFDPTTLRKHDATAVNALNFPDHWQQGNLTLPLAYEFEPKAEDDGVSICIPLPLINQVQDSGFDWLVPGMRHELIVSLIKQLPKKLRKNFVPAPDYADACLETLQPQDSKGHPLSLIAALTDKLFRMTGVKLQANEWQTQDLPIHLRFNFKVLDHNNKLLDQGRDLAALKQRLSGKVAKTLSKAATPELEQSGLTDWNFGELPQEFTRNTAGFKVKAYPALVANKDSVDIKLFDNAQQAVVQHQQGVRQLIRLAIPSPIKYLQENLSNKTKLGLYFNPFGQIQPLIDDCINAALDKLISDYSSQHQTLLRDQDAFAECRDYCREQINPLVLDIAQKLEKGLTIAHSIQKRMKGKVPLNVVSVLAKIKSHLDSLVFIGFVSELGVERLSDWQRYLMALQRRTEKLEIDPARDKQHQLTIEKLEASYQGMMNKLPQHYPVPDAMQAIRWMIEELRVSLFAQQLGTKMPISAKRITMALNDLDEC